MSVTSKTVDNTLDDLLVDVPLLLHGNMTAKKRFYGVSDSLLLGVSQKRRRRGRGSGGSSS